MKYELATSGLVLALGAACASDPGTGAEGLSETEGTPDRIESTSSKPSVNQIGQAAACPEFVATNSEHVAAGRARSESATLLFFTLDLFYANGTNQFLGVDGAAQTTLYEIAGGSFSLSDGTCGSGGENPSTSCLQPGSGDYASRGPYRVRREVVDLGPGIAPGQATGEFTIFYPEPFEPACPHPIAAWGNGTFVTGPDVYGFFNENAASWGVVVIASHDSNTGSGNYHRAGLDYLLEQNANPSSKFYGKLDTRAGVSGHSQGGAGASAAATHPSVEALIPIGFSGPPRDKAYLCLTGTLDIAPAGCRTTVQAATGPGLAAIWEGGDHVRTETLLGLVTGDPGTVQMMRLYTAWYRCFLADDARACSLFEGADCGVCNDSGWAELIRRNL